MIAIVTEYARSRDLKLGAGFSFVRMADASAWVTDTSAWMANTSVRMADTGAEAGDTGVRVGDTGLSCKF